MVRAQDITPSRVMQDSGAIRSPSRIDPSRPAIILIRNINSLPQGEPDPPPGSATGCAGRRYPAMWWRQDDIPKTAEEREAEIASLIRRRDRMLERAPMSAISGQLVRGLMLLLILMSSAQGIVTHYRFVDAWVVYGVCGALCLVVLTIPCAFLRCPTAGQCPAWSDTKAIARGIYKIGSTGFGRRSRRMVEWNQTAKDSNRGA